MYYNQPVIPIRVIQIYFLLLFNCFALQGQEVEKDYIHYTVDDGLPSNRVYKVFQTKSGFIWLCTDAGFSRFDGSEFRTLTIHDGLPDHEILDVFVDSKDRMWFYTTNGKLAYMYDEYNLKIHHIEDAGFSSRICSIQEDQEGNILIATITNGVKIIKNNYVLEKLNIPEWNLSSMISMKDGSILLCTVEGVYLYKNDSINKIIDDEEFRRTFAAKAVVFNRKLYTTSVGGTGMMEYGLEYTKKEYINKSEQKIYNMYDTENGIIICSKNGTSIYNGQNLFNINSIENATYYFKTKSQDEWVSTLDKGVFFINKKQVNQIFPLKNINDKVVNVIHTDTELVCATKEYIYQIDGNVIKRHLSKFGGINAIYINSNGEYLIGHNSGNLVLKEHSIELFHSIRSITELKNNYIISSKESVYQINYSEGFQKNKFMLFALNGANKLLKDSDSTFWMATDQGLYYHNGDTVFRIDENILKVRINDVAIQGQKIWIATDGNGLFLKNDTILTQFTTSDDLLSNSISVVKVNGNTIWSGTKFGLNKITVEDDNYSVQQITVSDGLTSNEVTAVDVFKDTVYVGTVNGLSYFTEKEDFKVVDKVVLYVDRLSVDNRSIMYSSNDNLVFDNDINNLTFEFGAIAFNRNNPIDFKYSLTNKDLDKKLNTWVFLDNKVISFWDLRPGIYKLFLKAKVRNGEWSEPLIFPFIISKPYWQKLWFYLLLSLAASMVGFLVYYRIRRSKDKILKYNHAVLNSELKALRAQINPHFLFNALNSIKRFILNADIRNADIYLSTVAKLMRRLFEQSENMMIDLYKEIETLQLYLDIESMRLENNFKYNIEVDEKIDTYTTRIPAMIIQPFIENAIWHGIMPNGKKDGIVSISFKITTENLVINVIDNGSGFKEIRNIEGEHKSSGIRLIKERLKLLSEYHGIAINSKIDSKVGEGTNVEINLPILITT